MRKLGQFLAKMRALAAEFRASFDEMARQSELDELRKEVEAMRRAQLADTATHVGNAEVSQAFTDIRDSLSGMSADIAAPQPAPYYEAPSEPAPPPAPARKPRPRAKTDGAPKTSTTKTATKPRAAAKPRARKSAAEPGE
jgi:sec-independent protein translocase protein TatB